MNRKRSRPNWFRIALLSLLVLAGAYVDRFVIATVPPVGVPTPTVTRAPESFVTEAEELFKNGKLLDSIEAYEQAIAADPDSPGIYISLARVQVFAGQYEAAQESAENAILLNPDNSMAHAVLAWALDFQGNYLDAQPEIERALQLDPNNALAHAYYAEILMDANLSGAGALGSLEHAIEESKVATGLAPDLLETRRARAYILENTQNYEEAIREYQAAVAINPNIAELHVALGRNYRALGIYDQAIQEFSQAISLDPDNPTPYLAISRTYATVGEFQKALQYAQSAVQVNPTESSLHGNLGVMYYRNLYWPEAVSELAYVVNGGFTEDGDRIDSINLLPDARIAEYYFTYGLALARVNRCGEALQIAQMIQARVPADELAQENAFEIINRCTANLSVTPTPPQAPTEAGPVSTETSEPEDMITPTP
ncbi:MAG: tetratricopeptide repeat protein [Chloroflexota bacterium]